MSEPAAPPSTLFKVYLIQDGVRGAWVGGSYDNISAVTIACALYTALEATYPDVHNAIGVYDGADAGIAFIGEHAGG